MLALLLFFTAFALLNLGIIAIHEAGHLLAARLVGYPWTECHIGPLKWSREDMRVRFSGQATGGLVKFDFREIELQGDEFQEIKRTRWRLTIVYLGGVIANCALGGLALFIISCMTLTQQTLAWPLGYAAILSLLVGLGNLLPFQAKGLMSDGYHLHLLWWGEVAREIKALKLKCLDK